MSTTGSPKPARPRDFVPFLVTAPRGRAMFLYSWPSTRPPGRLKK